jgi:flagellin
MNMIINHNLSAMNAHRQFKINSFDTQKNIEKLSSGLRINRAADDAAGLAVSEKMRAQIRGLNQASRNAQDGISLLQTAEGWLGETQNMLQRMRELAVQSANGIYTYEDRLQISQEIKQLVDEVDRVASQAEFNNLKLLRGGFQRDDTAFPDIEKYRKGEGPRPWAYADAKKDANPPVRPVGPGSVADDPTPHITATVRGNEVGGGDAVAIDPNLGNKGGVYFHIGSNMDHREQFYIENMSSYALGLAKGEYKHDAENRELQLDYLTQDGSNRAIAQLDSAIYIVSRQRADLGAYQNRLEHTIKAVDNAAENMQAAESRIRDVDMAKEMVDFVKNQILSQSSASMLAQANVRPQVVLKVLG